MSKLYTQNFVGGKIMAQAKKIIAAFLKTNEDTVDAILGNSNTMAAALN